MNVYIFYVSSGWLGGQVLAIAENVDTARVLASEKVAQDTRMTSRDGDKVEVGELIVSFGTDYEQAFILDDGDY